MKAEQDINREMLVLAGEINVCEVKLSALRQRIKGLDNISEYTENQVADLTKTQDRVKVEFAESVNLLYKRSYHESG